MPTPQTSSAQLLSLRTLLCGALAVSALLSGVAGAQSAQRSTTPAEAGRLLSQIAHDSLEGRLTGSVGAVKAARIIAAQMALIGLTPVGDDGFLQRVPIYAAPPRTPGGAARPSLAADFAALDTFPAAQRLPASNVIGLLRGSDPILRDEYIIVGAHYDHIGMNGARAVDGDSIFNGADDDASGVVAMLETARQLTEGGAPKRSVLFVAFIGEENGMTGTRWYLNQPVRPLAATIADFQIEMIARPDSLVGGPGKAWLTGYERSSMGEMLTAAGIALVQDPRPAMSFFTRSDNYPFALEGIPAHTISSFNGHSDYHQLNDEWEGADLPHFAAVINATARAVRLIADGPRPEWKEGGRPVRTPR